MSPSEAKAKHSATDLIRWSQRFDDELNEFHREDYGVARVAHEVYELRSTLAAIFGSKLPQMDTKDFVPKFTIGKEVIPLADMTEEEREQKLKEFSQASQARWLGMLGLDTDGKPIVPLQLPVPPAENGLPAQESPVFGKTGAGSGKVPAKTKTRRTIKPGGGN